MPTLAGTPMIATLPRTRTLTLHPLPQCQVNPELDVLVFVDAKGLEPQVFDVGGAWGLVILHAFTIDSNTCRSWLAFVFKSFA